MYSQRRFFTASGVSPCAATTHPSTAAIARPITTVFQFTAASSIASRHRSRPDPFSQRPELELDGDSPELRITSDKIEDGALSIPPDTDSDLVIALKPVCVWVSSADQGLHLSPTLTGSAKVGRIEFDELGTREDGVVHDSTPSLDSHVRGLS